MAEQLQVAGEINERAFSGKGEEGWSAMVKWNAAARDKCVFVLEIDIEPDLKAPWGRAPR